MRKLLSISCIICIFIFCLSFTNDRNISVDIPETNVILENDRQFYSFDLMQNNDTLTSIILDDKDEYQLVYETILGQNTLYGYINQQFFFDTNFDYSIFNDLKLRNISININSEIGQKLYQLRLNALKTYTNKYNELNVSLYSDSSYAQTSELKNITSSDQYIENYQYNTRQTLVKFDDNIVNIVPKSWFFQTGEHIYAGSEFLIYADTLKLPNYQLNAFQTHVFILDYDFTAPELTKEKGSSTFKTKETSNIFVQPKLNAYFIGLQRTNNIHNTMWENMNIDNSKVEVVLNPGNAATFGTSLYAPNIYTDLSSLTLSVENSSHNLIDDNIQYISYDTLKLYYSIENANINLTNKIVKTISATTFQLFLDIIESLVPNIGIASSIIDLAENIYNIWEEDKENENINIQSGEEIIDFTSESIGYSYPSVVSTKLPSLKNELFNKKTINYIYNLDIEYIFSTGDIIDYNKYLFNSTALLQFKLYNSNGDIIEYNNNEYFQAVLKNQDCRMIENTNLINNNYLSFSTNYGYTRSTICYKPSNDIRVILVETNGYAVDVNIYDENGRCIAWFNNEDNSNEYIICNLKQNSNYFISAKFNNNNGGNCKLTMNISSIPNITDNYTYNVTRGTTSKIFSLGSSTDKIVNLSTYSLNDTKFYIYNVYGALYGISDNPNAVWEEDSPDLNANINLGLYSSTTSYYIVVYTINPYLSFEISIDLFTLQGV